MEVHGTGEGLDGGEPGELSEAERILGEEIQQRIRPRAARDPLGMGSSAASAVQCLFGPFARWSSRRGEPSGPRLTVKMFKTLLSNTFKFEPCSPSCPHYDAKRR